jgi:hypothetical protein
MIIWLASYPRSGNTLTRTIFKNVFGIETYSDEKKPKHVWENDASNMVGHIEFEGNWPDTYQKMKSSHNVYYVKTHLPPIDDSPAIYIVRDGRMSSISYYHYNNKFFPEANRTILDILVGNDYYEDWSTHFRHWNPLNRQATLLVKFEDILLKSDFVIDEIENFLNIKRIKEWQNPFDDLNKKDPKFFREGQTIWENPRAWSSLHEMVFKTKHVPLMDTLGYCYDVNMSDKISQKDILEILSLHEKIASDKKMFEKAAYERLELINILSKKLNSKS